MATEDQTPEDTEGTDPKNLRIRMQNEFYRADFMEKKGFDINMLNVNDVEFGDEDDDGEESITITGISPTLTKEEKKTMYLEQIERVKQEKEEMADSYDQMVDRLLVSIEML